MTNNLKNLVSQYAKLRDEEDVLKNKHKKELADINERRKDLEINLMNMLNELQINSFKTDYGTISRRLTQTAKITDSDAFFDFVFETRKKELLYKQISQTSFKEYIDNFIEDFKSRNESIVSGYYAKCLNSACCKVSEQQAHVTAEKWVDEWLREIALENAVAGVSYISEYKILFKK